jgi:dUTP pyrophosphatase
MILKFKKLHEDAQIPHYASKGAAGFDLVAIEDVLLTTGQTKLIKTGLAVAVPYGYELQIRPRSGLSLKTGLRVVNSPGTVDSDYRGEVCVIMQATGGVYEIKKGDRIAQGVVTEVFQVDFEEVSDLDDTERGSGGFGSTGK